MDMEAGRTSHHIAIGDYRESMYYFNIPAVTSDSDQRIITELLARNYGVGILTGSFDEKLSVQMLSGFAIRLLGYPSPEEFYHATQGSLLQLINADEGYLRTRLQKADESIWACPVTGFDKRVIAVCIHSVVATSPTGEERWYLSIRRLGEYQFDCLTGDYNRFGFLSGITELSQGGEALEDYAILSINVLDFKAINDLYGASFGDDFLIMVAQYFNNSVLKPRLCARNESDKYALLVRRKTLDVTALMQLLKIPYIYGDKECIAECVAGIYYIADGKADVSTMLDNAAIARKSVTDAFIRPYAVFKPSMREAYAVKISALANFEEALHNNEFKVYYQPVVDCFSGKVSSAEALIRWESKDGLVSPATFIPILEENGAISRLDEYVFMNVVAFLHRREEEGLPLIPISVNLSRMDFFDEERLKRVYALLELDPIACNYIHFEITETSYRSIKDLQAEFINRVNALGGMVYIDDFGVENTSLDMLAQYEFAVMKLDMKFIRAMVLNNKIRTMMESTIQLAHKLGMKVIAEGVETEEQLADLRSIRCDYIQGYYFSKPMNETLFSQYLRNHSLARSSSLMRGEEQGDSCVSTADFSCHETFEEWQSNFINRHPSYFENRFRAKDISAVLHAVDLQSALLQNVAGQYVAMFVVNIQQDSFVEISCMPHVKAHFEGIHTASGILHLVTEELIAPGFRRDAAHFYDLSTLPKRLMGRNELVMDYDAAVAGWCRGQIIPIARDENGTTTDAVFMVQHIQAEKMKEEQLRILADTDGLSQLRNRRSGEREINRFCIEERHGMFCLFDVDNFKHYNDRYGHATGDNVIRIISSAMKQTFREKDILMRTGGDEFIVYAPGIMNRHNGIKKITELCKLIERLSADKYGEGIQISYGAVYTWERDYPCFDALYLAADALLYQCKNGKKQGNDSNIEKKP